MRYLFPVFLSILLVSISAWAGTWRDDFNDGDLDGWKMYKGIWEGKLIPDEGNWRVEDGVVIGGEEVPDTWHALNVSEGWSWSDYTAEVSVKFPKPLPIFATVELYISPEEGKSSGLEIANSGAIFARGYTYIHHPAKYNPIVGKRLNVEANKWYRLKIEVDEEGNIQCFVDDQPVIQFRGFQKGTPGFSAYQCVAMFDDFVVTGPGIPDREPGVTTVRPKGKLATTWARVKMF